MGISLTLHGWLQLCAHQLKESRDSKSNMTLKEVWSELWSTQDECIAQLARLLEESTNRWRTVRFLHSNTVKQLPTGDVLLIVVCDVATPPGTVYELRPGMVVYIISPTVGCTKAQAA